MKFNSEESRITYMTQVMRASLKPDNIIECRYSFDDDEMWGAILCGPISWDWTSVDFRIAARVGCEHTNEFRPPYEGEIYQGIVVDPGAVITSVGILGPQGESRWILRRISTAKKMTVAEIAKALGHEVEIIK